MVKRLNSYAIIFERGSGKLIIVERGSVRTVDFSKPDAVQESRTKAYFLPEIISPEYKKLLPPGLLWKAGDKPDGGNPKGPAAHTAPAGEFVFITSDGPLPAQPLDTGDGVTLELKRITFPPGEKRVKPPEGKGPVTHSGVYAILRWPARDGQPALEHGEQIVSDTLENPAKWAAAWQPGTKTVWLARRDSTQSRPGFTEMTFPDSKRITVKHIGVNLKDSLLPPAMPAGFRAKFGAFFDIAVPSGTGQPEYYETEQVHTAVQEDKKLHPGAAFASERLTDTGSAEWRVKFEHGETGKPVTEVLARLTIMDADGSKRQTMLRTWKAGEPFHINFGADGVLKVVLTGKQYASIIVEDENLSSGGVPVSYFGNVPESVSAGVKHTNVQEPFIVKVKARVKAADAKLDAANAPKPGAKLDAATEAQLVWGKAANGLRAALVMHPVPDEPDAEDRNDIFLVVQNVSPAKVWLHSSDAAPNPRQLIWREKGVLETVTETAKPIPADFQLQPREVAFFRMLRPPGSRNPGGRSTGSIIAASIHGDPDFDLTGNMEIEKAPAGAWTGKLLSGEIKGGTAIPVFSAAEEPKKGAATPAPDAPQRISEAAATPKAPSDNQAQPAKGGAKLDAATEAQLDWGAAVNGLRGAVVIRGEPQGIYLAVQNVSPAPLRFTDTVKAKDLRKFYPSDAQGILFAFTSDEPTQTDVLLQPREVAYLRMMPPLKEGEHSPEAGLIEGIRKDALQTWAMVLQIAAAPEGAWKGKLITAETRCALREGGPQPKNERAQALFKHWQNNARLNGDIPGGLVRLLHEKVKEFIRANEPDASGGPFAQKMKPLESRFANAGDWKAADVVALLDDIAAAHTIPLDNALTHLTERTLYPGMPLPASLEKADWGEPLPSGLRVAHLLEPRAGAYHLGTELKARIIFHNTGSQHVEFITDTFQQPGHAAKRADGSDIKLDATEWLTRGSMAAYRLAPGEYCEVNTPGLGIGAQVKGREDWENVRAGSWILCAAGDEVVFTPGAAALSYHETPEQKADWWLEFITERLNREAAVPADTKEREYLLYRVVRELYGTAPSTTEGDAFAADKSPDALKNLAALLAKHPYGKRSDGVIRAGSTKFRVLPPDADADKRPRVATGAGMFSLGDGVNFYVTQRAASNSVRNDASIVYYQQGKDAVVHNVPLPYGHDKWAAATMKGAKELWVAEFGTLRKYDFTNPLQPAETRYEADKLSDAPISIELRAALDPVLSKPAVAPKPKNPGPPPASAPATEKPKGAAAPGAATPEMRPKSATVEIGKDGSLRLDGQAFALDAFKAAAAEQSGRTFVIRADKDTPFAKVQEIVEALKNAGVKEVTFAIAQAVKLTPDGLLGRWRGKVNGKKLMLSFHRPPVEKDVQLDIYEGEATIGALARFKIADDGSSALVVLDSADSATYGTLRPGENGTLRLTLTRHEERVPDASIVLTRDAEPAATEPRQKEARELFEMWKTTANADGTIPGTFIGALATEVRAYLKANPNLDSGMKLPKLLPRFVTSRDWTQAEAIKLLDDVAYYSIEPIKARVAKAKLPSGPMWRTMVEFQDIPVQIAKWSEAKDGLRIGLRVVGGQWSAGGTVRVELWLHNAGGKDVSFRTAGPNRQDVEVMFSAVDAEGHEHSPEHNRLNIFAPLLDCTLPAGHVAMAKEFDVTFADADNDVRTALGSRFRDLKPGKYQLRSVLMLAGMTANSDKHIELTAPDFAFTLAAATAEAGDAKPAPKSQESRAQKPEGAAVPGGVLWNSTVPFRDLAKRDAGLSTGKAEVSGGGDFRLPDTSYPPGEFPSGGFDFQRATAETRERRPNVVTADRAEEAQRSARKRLEKAKEALDQAKLLRERKLIPQGALNEAQAEFLDAQLSWPIVVASNDPAGQPQANIKDDSRAEAKPEPVKVPDNEYVKAGFPEDELVGEGVMWNEVQNGMSLGYRITGDEWRILGKEVKVELWVRNSGDKDVKFQTTARPDIGLRMTLKDETGVKGAKEVEHESHIVPNDVPPFGELRLLPPRHALKVKEFTVSLLWPENDVSGIKGHYFLIAPGGYKFHCELELPGFSATGEGGKQLTPAAGEWTGKLTTSDRYVGVIAPDAPAPKPRVEHMDVGISKDGEVSLFRKKMPMDELKTRAARHAKKWFTIDADEDVPYAKVVEVVEALKAVGVTEISFNEARMGDGKYRVANRQAGHKLDDKHGFSMCRPDEYPQFFTVRWPAEGERPACWLRTYPNVSQETQGKWAVVWEPGTNVLWWVDDSDVGKMTVTDPMRVIVDREGRRNNFSRDFGLPDGVVTEFRRLGFEVGRDKTPGLENAIGGNTGGQSIVSAECGAWSIKGTVTDADGKPLADVPVRVTTNQQLKTEKTDAKGEYRAYFSLPLQLLSHWRGVTVEPVLEGFTEREMAKAGEFNVLLRAGEEPQHVRIAGDKDFQPGPIPRFAERDLIPSQPGASPGNPGRADFVMLKAGEITGEIVTADGKPAPPHFIAAATPEQRPGHNAAIEKSDAQGRFRLKGIPTNKPVIFTVNPDGKPGETSKSSEQKFEQSREHRIRITLPADGSGKGAVKIERLAIADIRHDSIKPPEQAHLWNDKYSAVAYQTEKDVNFVLVYEGFISSGMGESFSQTSGKWSIEGNMHLVDSKKTEAAGRNVDKRVIAVKHTSDEPGTLYLDGKAYDLAAPIGASGKAVQMSGRIFVLRDEGEPIQTARTSALRNAKDLVSIGDFAVHDRFMAETYADNRRVQKLEGWALAWDTQNPIQHSDGEYVAQMRIFPDGRVLSLSNGRDLKEFKIMPAELAELTRWLVEEQRIGEWKPDKVKLADTGEEIELSPVKNMWDAHTDILVFTHAGKRHGIAVEHTVSGALFDAIRERLWKVGKIGAAANAAPAETKPAEKPKAASPIRARDAWSAELLALSKVVAEARGIADAKAEDVIAWGKDEDGLRSGMLLPGRAKLGEQVTPLLVLKNVSGATKEMHVRTSLNVLEPTVHTADGKTFIETRKVWLTGTDASFPVTLKAGEHIEFAGPPVQFGVERDADGEPQPPKWPVAGVVMGEETVRVKFHLGNVRGPETGEVTVEVKAPGAAIRGKVLRPDGTPAAGVPVRVDDGIERWKWSGQGMPDLPKAVVTAADGTFSIAVPEGSVATNYNVFADSDAFAPMHATVPASGDVGVMQFAKGSRVTGRVFGLDGAGLAKVGIWCKQTDWRGRGYAPSKITKTGGDGTFSLPPVGTGKYVLQILTRDLGAADFRVAFADAVIEVKGDEPQSVDIRPLPTVDITLDARVLREKSKFTDFSFDIYGMLPGRGKEHPARFWRRQDSALLTEGKHVIAVPAGMTDVTIRAGSVHARKGDTSVCIFRLPGREERVVGSSLNLPLVDKAFTLGVTVQDAAVLKVLVFIVPEAGKKFGDITITGSAECEAWGKLALTDWGQANWPDRAERTVWLPACEKATFTLKCEGFEPVTRETGILKAGKTEEVRLVMKAAP